MNRDLYQCCSCGKEEFVDDKHTGKCISDIYYNFWCPKCGTNTYHLNIKDRTDQYIYKDITLDKRYY